MSMKATVDSCVRYRCANFLMFLMMDHEYESKLCIATFYNPVLTTLITMCRLGKDFPLDPSSGLFKCAICQVDQPSGEGLSINSGPFFSPASKPWEGPFLCAICRRKKDAMEGKKQVNRQ